MQSAIFSGGWLICERDWFVRSSFMQGFCVSIFHKPYCSSQTCPNVYERTNDEFSIPVYATKHSNRFRVCFSLNCNRFDFFFSSSFLSNLSFENNTHTHTHLRTQYLILIPWTIDKINFQFLFGSKWTNERKRKETKNQQQKQFLSQFYGL